jgi:hypothetical protein
MGKDLVGKWARCADLSGVPKYGRASWEVWAAGMDFGLEFVRRMFIFSLLLSFFISPFVESHR